jgi:lysophospholipase L1-like esterase
MSRSSSCNAASRGRPTRRINREDRPINLLRSRLVRRLRPGVGETLDTVDPFQAAWEAANVAARDGTGPLWLVLGDSTAQGIGAPSPERGYVGQLRARLEARDGRAWRVLNASRSGARVRDVLRRQLGWLESLPEPPDLLTCLAGSNDVMWRPRLGPTLTDVAALLERLPAGTIVGTVPRGLNERRALGVNDRIRAEAPGRGLVVADVWAHTGPPWAGKLAVDAFHPSERGYRDWTAALAEALGLPAAPPPST